MKTEIVNRVRDCRLERGMTQEELAGEAGVSRQSVIAIERGRYVPSLALALRLAEIFGCATDELFQRREVDR